MGGSLTPRPIRKHSPKAPSDRATRSRQPGRLRRLAHLCLRVFHEQDLNSRRALLLIWAGTRLIVLLVWGLFTPETQGDVVYYFQHIDALGEIGPRATMPEYPTPVLWLLMIPWVLGLGSQQGYVIAFVLLMLALDAGFSLGLWHLGGRLRAHAIMFWSLFVATIGPTAYLRFDLVTSILAGGSLLMLVSRRPAGAGVLAGVGAAIKLWPALLWPALAGRPPARIRRRTSMGFWSAGTLLAVTSWLWAGWDRLVSPLTWQQGRGLQVESVWATVPMLLRALGLGDYAVTISRYQAFEIYGYAVPFWTRMASLATLLGMIGLLVAFVSWWRRANIDPLGAMALILLVILVMIVTNKTLSPQYMIWLGGPVAAGFVLLGRRLPTTRDYPRERRRLWVVAVWLLALTLATWLVFPIGYDPLVRDYWLAQWLRLPITLILVARNLGICALLAYVVGWVIDLLNLLPAKPRSSRSEDE